MNPREAAVKAALDRVRAHCDVDARREADPVAFAHRYEDWDDQELVALVAACVAFGRVETIRAKLEDLLARLGPHPALAADDPPALRARLRSWKHRVFRGEEVARLLCGARAVQREHGTLGALFASEIGARSSLREALGAWCDAIRGAAGSRLRTLLGDPRGASGNKRLLLFLRWMVRPADGVDLGLWSRDVDPAALLVPVDVHIHRLAGNLGLTRRRTLSWRTTQEITAALARLDPRDPAGYDFSLCHMGMSLRCPSRRDAVRCEGCGVKPVCIHWGRASSDKVVSRRPLPDE